MLRRQYIYLKEMYPPLSRFIMSAVLFYSTLFLILSNTRAPTYHFAVTDLLVIVSVFTFLLSLRIADEFKDLDTDYKNFPNRPLPSGRVKKMDLLVLLGALQLPVIVLNMLYIPNVWLFAVLNVYGILMTVWFFAKDLIKNNLVLALLTHNPVQVLLISYMALYVCTFYDIDFFSKPVLLTIVALYVPALLWEIGRKIRAPKDETAYTTYSKIWGYKNAVRTIMVIMLISVVVNYLLLVTISMPALVLMLLATLIAGMLCVNYIKNPQKIPFLTITTFFVYTQQLLLLAASWLYVSG